MPALLKCVYINLDTATARRQALEHSFHEYAKPGFELARFPAIRATAGSIPGGAPPAAKGCFLSHRQVILDHPADAAAPLMVLEDDARFGPSFFSTIGRFITPAKFEWDVLFTDICVTNAAMMAHLARLRPELSETGKFALVDLKGTGFAAAAAYIINPRALGKVQGQLQALQRIEAPYDMYLRRLVDTGALRAAAVFPFLTTLSRHSEDSAIQPDDTISTDLVWNTYRKMVWADRDLAECAPLLETIREHGCDAESLMFAPVLCATASRKYRRK